MHNINIVIFIVNLNYLKKNYLNYEVLCYTIRHKNNITYRCIPHASGVGLSSNDIITIHGNKKVYKFN